MSFDLALFKYLNSITLQFPYLNFLFIFLSKYLPYVLTFIVVWLLFIWHKSLFHKFRLVFTFILTLGLAYFLMYIFAHLVWPRQRPFFDISSTNKLIEAFGTSFPSKHAFFFFLLAYFVWSIKRSIGLWFFLGASLISVNRIVVGVHYPLDVLSGALLGLCFGVLSIKALRKI
jgi:undecaprenyl-diphosphatase